ncbi:MAG: hypothetical protein HFH89_10835 [Lachnospiraceae bacterium]|nr:hypothetical protein [uncultured Acetatifactor sp.]MCI8288134.1 hypothetical protein [Lachnospiraceae bacterium]
MHSHAESRQREGNAYCRRDVRLARMACELKKIPYMNFMDYMENRPEYISQRFRENIGI